MLKNKRVGIILACVLMLSGCGNASRVGSKLTNENGVDKVLSSQVAAENDKKADNTGTGEETTVNENRASSVDAEKKMEKTDTNTNVEAAADVDIDLTVMSSDMVYATVYQLMFESEDYVGKTIKIKGTYYATWYERTQQYYHCVIIKDATACCSQGIEFIWGDGSHVYPDEYPADETEVEVVGEFEIYTEDGYEYCRLKNASLKTV